MGAAGQLLPSPPVIPHKPETLRKRPRKQKVLTVSQMNARDEYLGARNEKKQADVRRKEELAAAGLRRRMAVAQQDTQKMVEEKKVDRSNRRQAMVKRQQTTQQQREAAEAQRAAEKEAAAAARRKAAVQCTADLDQGMLVSPCAPFIANSGCLVYQCRGLDAALCLNAHCCCVVVFMVSKQELQSTNFCELPGSPVNGLVVISCLGCKQHAYA